MFRYFNLLSDLSTADIAKLKADLEASKVHPKAVKQQLARELTTRFHDAEAADKAEANFTRIFTDHALPEDMPEMTFPASPNPVSLPRLLVDCDLVKGTGEGRRLMQQNAVTVGYDKVTDPEATLPATGTYLIKVGKRRFCKVIFS
jgi:tyrosyl-tRNA synthetase